MGQSRTCDLCGYYKAGGTGFVHVAYFAFYRCYAVVGFAGVCDVKVTVLVSVLQKTVIECNAGMLLH